MLRRSLIALARRGHEVGVAAGSPRGPGVQSYIGTCFTIIVQLAHNALQALTAEGSPAAAWRALQQSRVRA